MTRDKRDTPARLKVKGILLLVALILIVLPTAFVWANSGVSQGFTTTESDLTPGMLMGLKQNSDRVVEPAVSTHSYQLLGVETDKPLIALSQGGNEVQVVVSGLSTALVSNINGNVVPGDRITASPIRGVGMKATDSGQIVGSTQQGLNDVKTETETITDKTGKKQTIKVGLVPIQVSVGYYSGDQGQSKLASLLPPTLISVANNIAGKPVSPLRVLVALFALGLGFIVAANMLQAGIRSGMIALGRNPLAKRALRRELLDICLAALGVLVLTIVVVYIILKI